MAKKYEFHDLAAIFPMMDADEFEALKDDIAENGLVNPIMLYEGKILDGRNRYNACLDTKTEPTYETYEGDDPVGYVISLNATRRDLTAGQRALAAARVPTVGRGGRPKERPDALRRTDVAKRFKVSGELVSQAKNLLKEAPDLADQVESGALYITKAFDELKKRRAKTKKEQERAELAKAYKDAIDSGDITIEQAIKEIQDKAEHDKQVIEERKDIVENIVLNISKAASVLRNDVLNGAMRLDEINTKIIEESIEPDADHDLDTDYVKETLDKIDESLRIIRSWVSGDSGTDWDTEFINMEK
jgi:hypothetical protein